MNENMDLGRLFTPPAKASANPLLDYLRQQRPAMMAGVTEQRFNPPTDPVRELGGAIKRAQTPPAVSLQDLQDPTRNLYQESKAALPVMDFVPGGGLVTGPKKIMDGDIPGGVIDLGLVPLDVVSGGLAGKAAGGILAKLFGGKAAGLAAMTAGKKASGEIGALLMGGQKAPAAKRLDMSEKARRARAEEQGYQFGYFRGGKKENDGEFFSKDKEYSGGMDRGDFREYAIRPGQSLDFNLSYSPRLLEDAADLLEKDGSLKLGGIYRDMAKNGERITGALFYQSLERLAASSPETYLKDLGFASLNTGRDVRVLTKTGRRDAEKAKFDPARLNEPDIYAGLAGATLVPGLLGSGQTER